MASHELEAHLKPLAEQTPLGAEKLSAAWDALSGETKIRLLTSFDTGTPGVVIQRALADPNPYIRFLGARAIEQSRLWGGVPTEGELVERALRDSHALVRAALADVRDTDDFFTVSRLDRMIHLQTGFEGSFFIQGVVQAKQAISESRITVSELAEAIEVGLSNPQLAESSYVASMVWDEVPFLPWEVASALIRGLSISDSSPSREVAEQMTTLHDARGTSALELLFNYRRDEELSSLRLHFLRSPAGEIRKAAANGIVIAPEAFAELLNSPDNAETLKLLADRAVGSLPVLEYLSDRYSLAASIKVRARKLPKSWRGEVYELRLMRLASDLASWTDERWLDAKRYEPRPTRYSQPWPLQLRPHVVANDAWRTFMNLRGERVAIKDFRLPRLEELGEVAREFDDNGNLSLESRVRESTEREVELARAISRLVDDLHRIGAWPESFFKLVYVALGAWLALEAVSWAWNHLTY